MTLKGAFLSTFLLVWGLPSPSSGAEVQAIFGMAYDSNLFEGPDSSQSGWVNRFFISSKGTLLRGVHSDLRIKYEGGVKRLWQADNQIGGPVGEVVVNLMEVSAQSRLGPWLVVSTSGQAKAKQATRIQGEESYLRGSISGKATSRLHRDIFGSVHYHRGGDDSRDASLPEVSLHEVGIEGHYSPSRSLRLRLRVVRRWLGYGRSAYVNDMEDVGPAPFQQSDVLRVLSADVQLYRGMLVHLTYAHLFNRSNSYGYGFRAQRIQLLVIRHLGFGMDGQAFLNVQLRRYQDPLAPRPGSDLEIDQYEQTMGILKVSRQISRKWGISLQYGYHRNGARQRGGFYLRHLYSFALETDL